MQVSLGRVLFDGTADPRAKYTIELDGLKGLFGGVGVRGESVERSFAHGDYSLPVFREARVLTLRGNVHSVGLVEQQMDLSGLGSVMADGGRETFTVQADFGVRWCVVELAGPPDIEVLVPGRLARFQVMVRARDPRLMGVERVVSGSSVTVVNHGTFPASPSVVVTGPQSAPYSVSGPGGRSFQVTQALSAGQSHRIDLRSGRVYRDGVFQIGAVGRAQVWTVPPGGTAGMSISAGSMQVTVHDTYV